MLAVAPTVTLTGPGGIGKSRLALRAAHQFARHFPVGVWRIEVAELDNTDVLVYAGAWNEWCSTMTCTTNAFSNLKRKD